jgi:hypothetical protein
VEDSPENFGDRMTRLKRERGIPLGGPGRKPIAERYQNQIAAVEQAFADALPTLAGEYTDALRVHDPETCPEHRTVLRCPAVACTTHSRRTQFNHKAAAYVFDRLLGKPGPRPENTVKVSFIEEISTVVFEAFQDANGLPTPQERERRMGQLLTQLSEASQER